MDTYYKEGGELADKITDKQMTLIERMEKEYHRLGFNKEVARSFAARVGIKVIRDMKSECLPK